MRNKIKSAIASIVTGAVGLAVGWIFSNQFVLGLIITGIITVATVICWLVIAFYDRKFSILRMLQDDIKANRNYEVIKMGLGMSRPLFLAGRNFERVKIGEIVIEAIDNEIVNNGRTVAKNLLKAQFLIDDCGWSNFLLGGEKGIPIAEDNIKKGLLECNLITIDNNNEKDVLKLVLKGLRHLLGMQIHAFSDKKVDELLKNVALFRQYEDNIHRYADLMGFLYNDPTLCYDGMKDFDYYHDLFCEIINDPDDRTMFQRLRNWMVSIVDSKDESKSVLAQSHDFRSRYFIEKSKIANIHFRMGDTDEEEYKKLRDDYLQKARHEAIKMMLVYARSAEDISLLRSQTEFVEPIESFEADYLAKAPDEERFVKGYILLGTSLMETNTHINLAIAEHLFEQGAAACEDVDRTDTYVRTQRKIISVRDRRYKFLVNRANSVKMKDIKLILDGMKEIEKATTKRLGHPDVKMKKSCKERRKFYRREMRRLKRDN
ncbi:MAG: hypothetical protein J1F65_02680 [Clostridiales bacterium]|nr:hypothetical protein [Clostridiales bacterium]